MGLSIEAGRGFEVDVGALAGAGQGRVPSLGGEDVGGEDEGSFDGGALGLVDGHGVAVSQVAGFEVGDVERDGAVVVIDGGEQPMASFNASHTQPSAVEDTPVVVVAQREDVVADCEASSVDDELIGSDHAVGL